MCHYITAVLPHTVDPTAVASLFDSYKLGFEIISNPHVVGQIDLKAWYILTSGKHCDCGTALGSLTRQARAQGLSYDREVEKSRKQGWSEAKIKRWLEQKEQTQERHRREDEALAVSGADSQRWLAFLNKEIDWVNIPLEFLNMALPNGKPAPWLAKRTPQRQRSISDSEINKRCTKR